MGGSRIDAARQQYFSNEPDSPTAVSARSVRAGALRPPAFFEVCMRAACGGGGVGCVWGGWGRSQAEVALHSIRPESWAATNRVWYTAPCAGVPAGGGKGVEGNGRKVR